MSEMDGTSKCGDCGEKFNRFSGYDFAGKLCNKCLAKKDSLKDSNNENEGFGSMFGTNTKSEGSSMFGGL